MLRLAAAAPRTAAAWTSSRTSHEQRGLKHRPDGAIRMVPVPPVLVAMLRAHQAPYGTAPDGRLFRGTRGGPLSESVYGRAWHAARTLALGPGLAASGLARRPCDLRHADLSLWLNAGGDPAQIAGRAQRHGPTHRLQPLHPRPRRSPQPADRPRPRTARLTWSVPVRGKPAVALTARWAPTPSAIRPWLPRPARRQPADRVGAKRAQARSVILATIVYTVQINY